MSDTTTSKSRNLIIGGALLCGLGLAGAALAVTANAVSNGASGATTHSSTTDRPSAAVETLQRELGQLNYYEGPVDGIMGPQTVSAIDDLQRSADLPQTGTMNAATDTALVHELAAGDNQMGGNN
jgi:peptidoglycan hydrolase-like protein with peptidoglycan-binding domain